MKHTLIFIMSLAMTVSARASVHISPVDTIAETPVFNDTEMLRPLEPTYLKGTFVSSPWKDNWFFQVRGGANSFLGKPLGCNDLFGRMKPTFNVAVGKWFTPSIGGRMDYSRCQFKDCNSESQDYQYLHADLLWNVLGGYSKENNQLARWSVIPYVGVGMMHNIENGKKPFAISYGVQGQYRLSKRISVVAELGNITTMQDFDGYGKSGKFGDNLLSLTAGLSINIGPVGWKRAIDARPYIAQNEWLTEYATKLYGTNLRYKSLHDKDARTLAELKKILQIEGLLSKYGGVFENSAGNSTEISYPRNDYSGLNSLRARLRHKDWNGNSPLTSDSSDSSENSGTNASTDCSNYLSLMQEGKECIGSPILFFFELGTTNLTDKSQLVNLDELARVAQKYGLTVKVIGAADEATGTDEINDPLSASRARYIYHELLKRGLSKKDIVAMKRGGIDDYEPIEANRDTKVMLYMK